ncbi:MAG: hypothetical protein ACO3GX_11590 [Gemmataceae bacterium]
MKPEKGNGAITLNVLAVIFLASAGVAYGVYFAVASSFETKLTVKKLEHLETSNKLEEDSKKNSEKLALSKKELEGIKQDLQSIKIEDTKSKITPLDSEKEDLEKEIITSTKLKEAIQTADDKAKLILPVGIVKDLIEAVQKANLAKTAITANFDMEHLEKGKAIKIPDIKTQENPLLVFITKAVEQEKTNLSAERKIIEGKVRVLDLSNAMQKYKKEFLESLPPQAMEMDVLEFEFPNFETLAPYFPSEDNQKKLNLFFALEYFPKNKTKLLKIINTYKFKKNQEAEIKVARENWLKTHWNPMEELITKTGIIQK